MVHTQIRPGGTEPTVIVYHWPPNAFLNLLVLVVLGYLVISYWRWARPCDTCGEFREGCRCKARE